MAFEKQIEEGLEFLDNWYGDKSWVMAVDLGELDLASGCSCILGQLNGDYDHMLDQLGIEDEIDAARLGFCLSPYDPEPPEPFAVKQQWEQLTEGWTAAIKDRMDQGIEL